MRLCVQAVYLARLFPFSVNVSKFLSTRDGAGLNFQRTCLGSAGFYWERLGQGHTPLQPVALPPSCGVPWAALPPPAPCQGRREGTGDDLRSDSHFRWVVAVCQVCRGHLCALGDKGGLGVTRWEEAGR